MRLTEALDAALSERYALSRKSVGREPAQPITEQRGLQTRMERIMRKFRPAKGRPSVRRQAAAAAGVPYSTWNHALKGRKVTPKTLEKISGAFTRLVTGPARILRAKTVGYPDTWLITAVVVASPGDPDEGPEDNSGGSRYVNGHGSGMTRDEVDALDTDDPGYRTFRAEGLDSEAIVSSWATGGPDAGASTLLDEIEEAYGTEFGFEGDNVKVELA